MNQVSAPPAYRPTAMLWSLLVIGWALTPSAVLADDFQFFLRSRQPTEPDASRFHTVQQTENWQPQETAIIVCDMWDAHHCLNAVRRVVQLAPRMNEVLHAARDRGALIIHAPSSCMDAYRDHPAFQRAQSTPRAESLPDRIEQWCDQIPAEQGGQYPIDQSDGGEDDDLDEHAAWAKLLAEKGLNPRAPWKKQTELLDIDADIDFISDDGQVIWSILEAQQRKNVILVGVHTNMCVLGRPFGLRQMAQNGKRVVLMRDMTDTMYNPARRPFVSHFTGTDLIVEHIEKWVCPTITSDQLLGGTEFRFPGDRRRHLVIVSAEREYQTQDTLRTFALQHLGHDFRVSFVFADSTNRNHLPGIEVLDSADVALISVRRRLLPPDQMAVIRRYVAAGKPLVGIRTANHAFCLRNQPAPDGLEDWPHWDAQIMGGSYTNHYGNGPQTMVESVTPSHPILQGVGELHGGGSLYKVSPLQATATPLLFGKIEGKPAEPIAWTNVTEFGNRVFYTSLGHPADFDQPSFCQLLTNALRWAANSPSTAADPAR